MVSGLFALVLANQTVLMSNAHNFLTVPSPLLSGEEWTAKGEVSWKVRLIEPSTEFIPSWTGKTAPDEWVTIAIKPGWGSEPWFQLGTWSSGKARTSINDQKNDYGQVLTDILETKSPTDRLEIKITRNPGSDPSTTQLTEFNLVARGKKPVSTSEAKPVSLLNVPKRAQMSYEGGNVLCSPTSVSMILAYWSDVLVKPELDHDVPQVQKGVHDPAWGGTGNWPFNVAYAGSLPGMTGYVTRLRGLDDLTQWLEAKVPVACSVSYSLLKGNEKPSSNDGHIVVLIGFDKDGNPVFNDPGRNVVRMTYDRAAFERAWSHSGQTVYLIHPKFWSTPTDGPWPSRNHTESNS